MTTEDQIKAIMRAEINCGRRFLVDAICVDRLATDFAREFGKIKARPLSDPRTIMRIAALAIAANELMFDNARNLRIGKAFEAIWREVDDFARESLTGDSLQAYSLLTQKD